MSKLVIFAFALLLVCSLANQQNPKVPTPVKVAPGAEITFHVVFPAVDKFLKETYWYYLRGADNFYQSSVNTKESFLFFVIYRNIVGTFLVITTWDKAEQTTQVNTFVRLGNGYAAGSGALYEPVKIDPLVLQLQLGEEEFQVTINDDGSISVVGGDSQEGENTNTNTGFDVEKDMNEKCGFVNTFITDKYWYYLRGASVLSASHTPTSQRYYCVFVYVNIVGTFLVIGNYELETQASAVNTFVRLGNGYDVDSEALYGPVNYTPVKLSPAVLEMKHFGQWFISQWLIQVLFSNSFSFLHSFIPLNSQYFIFEYLSKYLIESQ